MQNKTKQKKQAFNIGDQLRNERIFLKHKSFFRFRLDLALNFNTSLLILKDLDYGFIVLFFIFFTTILTDITNRCYTN